MEHSILQVDRPPGPLFSISRYLDRNWLYSIELDGVAVGRIPSNGSVTLRINPGRHEILVRTPPVQDLFRELPGYHSQSVVFDAAAGETVRFECGNNVRGLNQFANMHWIKHKYLFIERR